MSGRLRCILLTRLDGTCRVHKPGGPRGPASTPGLGPGEQHVVHGPAQKSKNTTSRKDSPVADRKVCPKERTPAHQLLRPTSDRSARPGHRPPREVSPIGRPSPKRCFLLRPCDSDRGPVGSLRTALLRLTQPGPTGAIQPGTPARKGPGANGEHNALSQTTIPGPYPTPTKTVLHDRPDTSSIVGADICVYSIVGVVGLPYGKKPPTCLWASVVGTRIHHTWYTW